MTPLTKTTLLKEDNMLKRNLFLVAIPIIGLIIVVFVTLLSPVNELATASENEANLQRSFEADAARYNAMAAFYLAKDEARTQWAVEAEAARYQELAEFYLLQTLSQN